MNEIVNGRRVRRFCIYAIRRTVSRFNWKHFEIRAYATNPDDFYDSPGPPPGMRRQARRLGFVEAATKHEAELIAKSKGWKDNHGRLRK